MSSTDFMPIKGWDHLELYVGNAKQAYFYERLRVHADRLRGTGDRRAGPRVYVLDQNDIRLVITSGLRPDSDITKFACAHGDGVKDVALSVPTRPRPTARPSSAREASPSRTGSRTTTAGLSWHRSRLTATTSTRS